MCLFLFAAKSVLYFLLEGGSHWLGLPNDLEEFQENSPIFQSWDAFFRCLLVGRLQVFFEKKHMHILYGKKTVDVKCWCGGFWIWKSFAVLGCFGSNICCWMFFRSLVWNVYSKNDSSFALTFMYRFFTGTTYCKYIYIYIHTSHMFTRWYKHISCLKRGPVWILPELSGIYTLFQVSLGGISWREVTGLWSTWMSSWTEVKINGL